MVATRLSKSTLHGLLILWYGSIFDTQLLNRMRLCVNTGTSGKVITTPEQHTQMITTSTQAWECAKPLGLIVPELPEMLVCNQL